MSDPLLIWGAGAMGGSLGAWLRRAGHEVLLVDADEDHVSAIQERGLRITGPVERFTVRAPAVTPGEVEGAFRRIVLAVKAHHTAGAAGQLAPHLAGDGWVLSMQNGLNEEVIASVVGPERTVGCFVNFGADVVEPGVVMRGNRGAVVVGELDGSTGRRISAVHQLFRDFEPDAVLTDNIQGYLWGKLAYGALLFATALTDATIAEVLASERHRPTLVELGREVMRVALAKGIRPEAFDGFDPAAFHPDAPAAAAHDSLDRLVAFNRGSAKSRSGVWRDLAVRKRKTEVDAQIAPIARHGAGVGVPTPRVDRLVELVHQVEGGRGQGWDVLDDLATG